MGKQSPRCPVFLQQKRGVPSPSKRRLECTCPQIPAGHLGRDIEALQVTQLAALCYNLQAQAGMHQRLHSLLRERVSGKHCPR